MQAERGGLRLGYTVVGVDGELVAGRREMERRVEQAVQKHRLAAGGGGDDADTKVAAALHFKNPTF